MGRRLVRAGFIALASLGLFLLLMAQANGQDTHPAANPGGTVTSPLQIAVSGCLKYTDKSGEYSIVDNQGRIWKLVPGSVSLAEKVNHRVMITGKPETTNPAQTENLQDARRQQVGVRVLTVKMLSASCAP